MSPRVGQNIQASLFIGLAIFITNCSGLNTHIPVWHSPHRLVGNTLQESTIHNERKLKKVYAIVDEQPSYPGGTSAWFDHLRKNKRYPGAQKIKGQVILAFDVTKNGDPVNIRALKSFDLSYTKEAIRLLITSGKWSPARQNGEVVNAGTQIRLKF